jgi:hypothetical protein
VHRRFFVLFVVAWLPSTATTQAVAQSSGGDAAAIVKPRNGETVHSPVTIVVSVGESDTANMNDMPRDPHGAHWHLFIDAPPPTPGRMVPIDAHHVHLMRGETRTTVRLPVGSHTIQLFEGSGSHVIASGARHSKPVTFAVQ